MTGDWCLFVGSALSVFKGAEHLPIAALLITNTLVFINASDCITSFFIVRLKYLQRNLLLSALVALFN